MIKSQAEAKARIARMKMWNAVKDYVFITLGVLIYTVGLTAFMLPYGLTSGGVTGIAQIVYYATGIEIQVTYSIINIILLLFAIKILGLKFCMKTIWAVVCITFGMWAMQRLIEIPDPNHIGQMMLPHYVDDQSFMAAVLGALTSGIGLAICFENNGSTGGTDIIAAIVNKYKPVSLGSSILAMNIIIISSCYFVFHDVARVIFGFVIMIISSITLDYCMRRSHQSVQFMIFSRNYKMISDAITRSGHGVTVLDGLGWYTKSERKTIVSIVRKRQAKDILRIIKYIDPYAMVSMSEAEGVFGKSFDTIRQEMKATESRRILVLCSNNGTKLDTARKVLGNSFEVRSLLEVGCDTRQAFNKVILKSEPQARVAFIKKFFGFDGFYFGEDGKVAFSEGDTNVEETVKYHSFESLEALKEYLTKE